MAGPRRFRLGEAMADVRVPEALRAAIEAEIAPGSIGGQAAALSDAYRARRPSSAAVKDGRDIAAYLTARLPATYAAIASALNEAAARVQGFAPMSLLDAGAGPGTASWAAAEIFPDLSRIVQLDENRPFLDIAGRLGRRSPHAALAGAEQLAANLGAGAPVARKFDLVVVGYALTEMADAAARQAALALWSRCSGLLVIVEPGRPADYGRLMLVREALFAAGAQIVAPCPHQNRCPLTEGDWCHFSVRLPRSRAHRQAKAGSLGYEDEKFSYLVVARPELGAMPASARLVRPSIVKKFEVELPLCAQGGLEARAVPRRDALAFKAAKKLDWGDALD